MARPSSGLTKSMVRLLMSFELVLRQTKTRRRVRTHCSTCTRPIFEDDEAVWLTKPMGLSHKTCEETS